MATMHCLHQFDEMLTNEWRERTYTTHLREVTAHLPDAARYARLYRDWEAQRPYERGQDAAPDESYPAYRHAHFDRFIDIAWLTVPEDVRRTWEKKIATAEAEELPAYLRQMSIMAYLDPGAYGETRVSVPAESIQIGIIHQGRYHLLPVFSSVNHKVLDVQTVRQQIVPGEWARGATDTAGRCQARCAVWPAR